MDESPQPRLACNDSEILDCFTVMQELRPHLSEEQFVERIRAQISAGYRLASLSQADRVVAVAGFRIGENLAWGRFLYVDDLIVTATQRSSGLGARLLNWLREQARAESCGQLHLDSGLQRLQAHAFYEREGMARASYHFAQSL